MGNQYYVSREDGETSGPFEDPDSALLWIVDDFADPDGLENGVPPLWQERANDLNEWYQSLVARQTTHSSVEYGFWLKAAKEFAIVADQLIFGVEFVVDPGEDRTDMISGIAHLIDPRQLHTPHRTMNIVPEV